MKRIISDAPLGSIIKYHEFNCVVLEHRPNGTLLMATESISHPFGASNNFATSTLRDYLNSLYLDNLTNNYPDEIITRTVDLTALNGSKEYGTCECKVAPLSLDEIRKYHGIVPNPKAYEWSVTPWNTTKGDEWIVVFGTDGAVYEDCCTGFFASRPAFLVLSSYTVDVDEVLLEQYSTKELIEVLAKRIGD